MARGNRTVFFYVTEEGHALARKLGAHYPGAPSVRLSREVVEGHWKKGERLVFVMAAGIVVRTIAPLLKDKRTDPAVVFLDELGGHVVSLLGGHAAGANTLAGEIARVTGGRAVITTATDAAGLPSLDLWAGEQGLVIEDWGRLPQAGAKLLRERCLRFFSHVPLKLPEAFFLTGEPSCADVLVTNRTDAVPGGDWHGVLLRPKNLVLGVGCNSGTSAGEIAGAVHAALDAHCLSFLSVRAVATIDKKGREPGLVAFASRHGLPLVFFTAAELNRVPGVRPSEAAERATGARAVAEPSALLAAPRGRLLVSKQRRGNVTVAIAEGVGRQRSKAAVRRPRRKGAIFLVGTGPGDADHVTPRALDAILRSEVIVGYAPYLDLIEGLITGKAREATGMTQEIERAGRAIELARQGRTVAVVSGGDPGIYAMAGLVLDLLRKGPSGRGTGPVVEVIPGISALNACAARLGAPLMHDFAAISLSDRLTPWETIEGRLNAAAEADFVIVLYNPRSRGRPTHIRKARRIIMRHRAPDTPVGIVRGAMRADEVVTVTDLSHLPFDEIDMQTTVIIGNSKTFVWEHLMITPRGYEEKEGW
jgi:cobalt-precorrin 5A hydrolase/precorrin-3B C17-methyltransferase